MFLSKSHFFILSWISSFFKVCLFVSYFFSFYSYAGDTYEVEQDAFNLGKQLYLGEGGETSIEEVCAWLKIAAEQGYAPAQEQFEITGACHAFNLGEQLYSGEGEETSIEEACVWLETAAEQGYAQAQEQFEITGACHAFNLGEQLYSGEGEETGIERGEQVQYFPYFMNLRHLKSLKPPTRDLRHLKGRFAPGRLVAPHRDMDLRHLKGFDFDPLTGDLSP